MSRSCLREKGVFLGCKTKQRTKDSAEAELHRSLERLGTDRGRAFLLGGWLAPGDGGTGEGAVAVEVLYVAGVVGVIEVVEQQAAARWGEVTFTKADDMRAQRGDLSPQARELKRLEELEPGLTRVEWGPDGEVLMPPLEQP